jgi:hypothetical protein
VSPAQPLSDLSSPVPVPIEAQSGFESAIAASVHTPEPPALHQREWESALALTREQKEKLAPAKKQSRRRTMSAPQKKENPWSALAPQYLLSNCSIQCNRRGPNVAV